jgi:hypothetical protein
MPESSRTFIGVVIAVLLTAALSNPAIGEQPLRTKVIDVIGSSKIYGQDAATAREQAISDSLVFAVNEIIADLISVDERIQNFQTINETIFEHLDPFVCNYKVLTESVSDDTYRVFIQATILVDTLAQRLSDIGVAQAKNPMPSILFLIAEQNLEDPSPKYWWGQDLGHSTAFSERAMAEKMREKGFSIINYETLLQNGNEGFSTYGHDLKDPEAVKIGVLLNADLVIIGKSVAQKAPNIMGEDIGSFQGIVTAYAISTEACEKIATTVQTFAAMNRDEILGSREVLAGAGTLAAEDIAAQISAVWRKQSNAIQKVKIIVDGTRHLGNFVLFKRILNDLPGMKEMQTSEVKADEATIIADFQGDAEKLAETLMLKTADPFGIKINEISENSIRMELLPR